MMNLVVDDEVVIERHQSEVAVLANLYVLKPLFELVPRRGEQFHESIERARADPIELRVESSGAIDGFLVVDRMKQHVGMQHELRQRVPILAEYVLTELLQQVANPGDVIRVGVELELLALRQGAFRRLRTAGVRRLRRSSGERATQNRC